MRALTTRSAEETVALGTRLGARLFDGAVVCLAGDLGAGKSRLAEGIARGLGVEGPVHSPTFVIVAEYPEARVPLRHADLYRLDRVAEARGVGIDERVGIDGAWVVEWADRFPELWPDDRLDVRLSFVGGDRRVEAVATGPRHAALLGAFDAP
ncbi:MAG: tRNA (adenosine(37)-N6)-threonylcarbamoyltransferase complex ATPase subunit type 1 TsaE [Myxococcota bacterium]